MAYQKLNYVAVDDLALPDDWNQMIDNQDWFNTLFNRGYIPAGLDADKPASPQVGNTYYATDTRRRYVCFTAGVWTWLAEEDVANGIRLNGNIRMPDGWTRGAAGDSFQTFYGVYAAYLGTVTGALVLRLPNIGGYHLMHVTIRGYSYNGGSARGHWTVALSWYTYSTSASTATTVYTVTGDAPFSKVRVGNDGTNSVIVLGDVADSWSYTFFTVDVMVKSLSTGITDTLRTGWGHVVVTDLSAYTLVSMTRWPRSGVASSATEFSTTSTTYVDVLTLSVVTASGRVMVGTTAPRLRNDDGAQSLFLRLVVGPEADDFFASVCTTLNPTASHQRVFDLGAGGTYTARLQARVSGSTGYVNYGALAKTTLWYYEL